MEIINLVRRFATSDTAHAFPTDLSADTPPRLLGKPLWEASDIDGTITATEDAGSWRSATSARAT